MLGYEGTDAELWKRVRTTPRSGRSFRVTVRVVDFTRRARAGVDVGPRDDGQALPAAALRSRAEIDEAPSRGATEADERPPGLTRV